MSECKTISIFGVTGSIGKSTCDVILSAPERFDVQVVTAFNKVEDLAQRAIDLGARKAIIGNKKHYKTLKSLLESHDIEVFGGRKALIAAAQEECDIFLAAIMGMAGLEPILEALPHCKVLAIANKEPLVAAGPLVLKTARKHKTKILPIDSEHNAIFQVFDKKNKQSIERLILTASGGPFLNTAIDKMANITPAQALAHPNWSMGAKISVDSATMVNKALEVIEAHYLFDMPAEKIDILIHPQSVIHSMVEYCDGSVLAQMGASDMRTPISYVLAWPERMGTPGERLDLRRLSELQFQEIDHKKFPAAALAYKCIAEGQAACIAFNAANEVAVENFLAQKICFQDIIPCIDSVLQAPHPDKISTLDEIIAWDVEVRMIAQNYFLDNKNEKKRVLI